VELPLHMPPLCCHPLMSEYVCERRQVHRAQMLDTGQSNTVVTHSVLTHAVLAQNTPGLHHSGSRLQTITCSLQVKHAGHGEWMPTEHTACCCCCQVSELVMLTRSDEDDMKVKALEYAAPPGQRVFAKVKKGKREERVYSRGLQRIAEPECLPHNLQTSTEGRCAGGRARGGGDVDKVCRG
jgi:hypothetical protein